MNAEDAVVVMVKVPADQYRALAGKVGREGVSGYLESLLRKQATPPAGLYARAYDGEPDPVRDEEVAVLRRAGYRLIPGSASPVKEYRRARTCFACDLLGRPKEWRCRGPFADFEDLEAGDGSVVKRVICAEHARRFGTAPAPADRED